MTRVKLSGSAAYLDQCHTCVAPQTMQDLSEGAIWVPRLSPRADISFSATNCTRLLQVAGWRRKMNHLDSAPWTDLSLTLTSETTDASSQKGSPHFPLILVNMQSSASQADYW